VSARRRSVFEWPLQPFERPGLLSRSERDIVRLLLSGQTIAGIGQERGTSPRTVSNQLSRIRRKLGGRRLEQGAGAMERRIRHLNRCRAFWRRVLSGRLHVEKVIVRSTRIVVVAARLPAPRQLLTAREQDALALAAGGLRIKQVSEDLGISTATADTYLRRAMAKLNMADRAVLEALAH
jgi:DNA-binding CsgD family transcriptional regulator